MVTHRIEPTGSSTKLATDVSVLVVSGTQFGEIFARTHPVSSGETVEDARVVWATV